MKVDLNLIGCESDIMATLKSFLSISNYHFLDIKSVDEIRKNAQGKSIIICTTKVFNDEIIKNDSLTNIPALVICNESLAINNFTHLLYDCISLPINKKELIFRLDNLLRLKDLNANLIDQNEKLRSYFDKNRKKTINLFGKHVDLKKAQKEIEIHNIKLEKAIQKNKIKTINLFGKHIDLKKAKKEISLKNEELERQKEKLQIAFDKKKRKTIDLFGKHTDLKKAQKEINEKNAKLEKAIEKNKQKTLELFGKHVDLKKAKKEIDHQNTHIAKQNRAITDSINYASFIQTAVITKDNSINEIIPKHMIIFMPRDIVSGDFYWIEQYGDQIYIVAADCTGHGVPGAFMSMLGISLLNEVVLRYRKKSVSQILDLLRDKVIHSLHQTGRMDEAADGMDLSFCVINKKTRLLQFAGAHNPVYIIRDKELTEIKGDRMPIGFSLRKNYSFSNHEYQLEKGDKLYLFSDGYPDQFGGENGMKMRYKVFQQHLLDSCEMSLENQKEYLLNKFMDWKGSYNQIDDVLVLGFEIE